MPPPPPRLVILPVSPWSERARWALDHHRLAYQTIHHTPFLGEPRLRRLVGPHKARATVPVLLDGARTLTESWDIALYADAQGKGEPLIPCERAAEIRAWTDRADEAMRAGRALLVAALLASPAALDESLPAGIPHVLRVLLRPMSRHGTRWFARKHGVGAGDPGASREALRTALLALREALAGGTGFLAGSFSYADIAAATLLQGVSPVADRFLPLGPATRAIWTRPDLALEFSDLLAWRDRLYAERRACPRSPG